MDHVAGYTLFNDVTARDWQRRTSQWALGKSFDTFGPLGPWIVTSDAVADPHDLLVEVVRDGVVTVSQSTSTMVFSMAFLVHHLSQVMTLDAGDVISTGSPQKLATVQDAHTPLAPGDAVTIRVAGIGELTTSFLASGGRRMILDAFRLDGKVALVTGSTRGLGQGAALALAEAGADLALLDRGDASETVARIEALGRRVHPMTLRLRDRDLGEARGGGRARR